MQELSKPVEVIETAAEKRTEETQKIEALYEERPTLSLETLVVFRGKETKATASGFEPGERVDLRLGAKVLDFATANKNGVAEFTFTAPLGGISFEITAVGWESAKKSSRFLNLASAK